jgi:O-antigen ligase
MLAGDTVADIFFDRVPPVLGPLPGVGAELPTLRWQAETVRRLIWPVLVMLLLTQITMAFAVVSPTAIELLVQVRRLTWLAVAIGVLSEVLAGDPADLLGPLGAFVPFVAAATVSALLSVEPVQGLAEIALWLITMFAACLVGKAMRSSNLPLVLAGWFMIVLLASIAIAVLRPSAGVVVDGRIAHGVWRGIFANKNWLAWYAGFAVLLAAFGGSLRAVVRLGLCATALVCLYHAHSAGTVVALVAVIAILAMIAFWRWLGLSIGLQILANSLVLGLAGIVGWGGYMVVLAAVGRNVTLTGRTSIWQAYFTRALDTWLFGAGPGSFTGLSLTTADVGLRFQNLGKIFTPHNMAIAIFGETGLIGLVAYGGAIAAILINVIRHPDCRWRMLLLAFTLYFLVSGLDETHEVFGVGSGLFLIVVLRAWQWPHLRGSANRNRGLAPIGGGPDHGGV